jgi:hypothetical protein
VSAWIALAQWGLPVLKHGGGAGDTLVGAGGTTRVPVSVVTLTHGQPSGNLFPIGSRTGNKRKWISRLGPAQATIRNGFPDWVPCRQPSGNGFPDWVPRRQKEGKKHMFSDKKQVFWKIDFPIGSRAGTNREIDFPIGSRAGSKREIDFPIGSRPGNNRAIDFQIVARVCNRQRATASTSADANASLAATYISHNSRQNSMLLSQI